ncbi:hypothetical protein SAMN04488535_1323 [Corynebacterium mycetoides]|uniref:Abi-like protein n=1 Tax=Corynebacterium mycetoides TaxID=38302 RepID=A0A1G9P7G7_9CORY|nr:hypothetical protein SAMN04488535_1323 [Corynebacterium mycetoides]
MLLKAGIDPGPSYQTVYNFDVEVNSRPSGQTTLDDLRAWFSSPRMDTYATHSFPVELYLWNTRITKAFLEDIQHFEVLYRNWIDGILSLEYGPKWFDNQRADGTNAGLAFNNMDRRGVNKARTRAGGAAASPGKVIAELTFDFWFHLLDRRHAATLHPKFVAALGYTHSISALITRIAPIYALRNRCSHHEPIIRHDLTEEAAYVGNILESIHRVSSWIDPEAGEWIAGSSRVPELYSLRPT